MFYDDNQHFIYFIFGSCLFRIINKISPGEIKQG